MREEFQIQRQGKTYVLFAGLLDEAHSRGLVGIDTELIQVPEEQNGQVSIVKATVQIEESSGSSGAGEIKTFTGIGDASPQNVSRNIVPHLIRMSETRAKARALRDAVNVSATALEEIADNDDRQSTQSTRSSSSGHSTSRRGSAQQKDQSGAGVGSGNSSSSGNVRNLPRQSASQQTSGVQDSAGEAAEGSEGRGESKAPQSQIDFIRTLAEEWRGEQGVERLEQRIGKPLPELSRSEAESWIDKLTPKDESGAGEEESG